MFINRGGLPEHHRPGTGGELHLQPHHHGHRRPQQFDQHHQPCRSRRVAARGRRLLPDPRHRGSLSPATLLLKPWTPHPITPPSPTSFTLPLHHGDHKTNTDGLHNPSLSSLS